MSLDDQSQEIEDITAKYNLPSQPTKKSSLPMIGGILLLIAGLLIITQSVVMIVQTDRIVSLIDFDIYTQMNVTITPEQVSSVLSICGTVTMVLAIFPILGGIQALQRKRLTIVIIGGILGIFALAPFFIFIPNVLSLIGLLFVIISKNEFKK